MFFPYRDENPSRSFPLLTLLLIGVNSYLFVRTAIPESLESVVQHFGFTPELALQRPYVLITSTFLHGGWLHLIGNMWFLWLYGDNIEDRYGRLPFLGLYLLAGIVGNFTHAFLTGFDSTLPVIGASGAVAGVMGSYLIRFPMARIRCVFLLVIYPILPRVHALFILGMWMVLEFYQAWIAIPGDHVAHWAHVGGFMTGVIWTLPRRGRYRERQGWWW